MAKDTQPLLERLLEADARQDWGAVRSLAREILAVDPADLDAQAYLRVAERRLRVAPASSAAPLPGPFCDGRYRALAVLSTDAMKRTYHCTDTRSNREVTLTLYGGQSLEPEERAILREAVEFAACGPHHEAVALVLDSGEHEGAPYAVTEYLPGGTLEAKLGKAEGSGLPPARVLHVGRAVCSALEAAHAAGMLHRRLTPSSIWLCDDGAAKVGD